MKTDPEFLRPAEVDHLVGDADQGARAARLGAARLVPRARGDDGRRRSRAALAKRAQEAPSDYELTFRAQESLQLLRHCAGEPRCAEEHDAGGDRADEEGPDRDQRDRDSERHGDRESRHEAEARAKVPANTDEDDQEGSREHRFGDDGGNGGTDCLVGRYQHEPERQDDDERSRVGDQQRRLTAHGDQPELPALAEEDGNERDRLDLSTGAASRYSSPPSMTRIGSAATARTSAHPAATRAPTSATRWRT